VVLAIRK